MAQLLSAVTPGTLVTLNESGSPVEFYVAAQNYESGLNGAGRTLMVRKNALPSNIKFSNNGTNSYVGSALQGISSAYINRLDSWAIAAAGTTKFYYSPGNGNYTTAVLEKASFDLSVTELGYSPQYSVSLGQTLPTSSVLSSVTTDSGTSVSTWTRTPRTQDYSGAQCAFISGGAFGTITSTSFCRPCFTLPGTLYVWDDGTVSQYAGPGPASITAPSLTMQGQSILVSWSSISGADSYILQRKADSGEWEQVYAGSDTTFTDTAGSWSTVQYQVCGVFDGTNGAFAQSDSITVVAASTLVISGQDGSLGTITNDITYYVMSDTGNTISLTRTVNGTLLASLTVNSGFAYNIPVMDLPTGTGTIVITATVQTSSDPVTITRTWTYTKAAQTFPGTGGVAQLTQDGQNVFPLTLAEAVKAIGGPWGGNLSTALDKLAMAATYTATAVPKYTEIKVDLSKVQPGDIVNLPENGVMTPFYVASLDYEPTLNTGGTRVLLVRKDVYQNGQWNESDVNAYAGSTIDTWFNSTYKPMLDSKVLAEIGETTFHYTPGNGSNEVTTLTRAVFALSLTELGEDGDESNFANIEGSALPIASKLTIAYLDGEAVTQWSRSPVPNYNTIAFSIMKTGIVADSTPRSTLGRRPAFTLPLTFTATLLVDATGTVHPEQEYTRAGDFADLWGNIIPTVKIETGSYVGTGTYGSSNPNTLTFSGTPYIGVIASSDSGIRPYNGYWGSGLLWYNGLSSTLASSTSTTINFELTGTTLLYYGTSASAQLNTSQTQYVYIMVII